VHIVALRQLSSKLNNFGRLSNQVLAPIKVTFD